MKKIYDFIDDKRRGLAHSAADIEDFIKLLVSEKVSDYQAAAWLMAVCINGMTDEETAALTFAMEKTGETLSYDLPKFCVDKHSTGGIGDKVTLFAAPVCATCGVYVPKMSGRGLGNTGGTIDKLESIPGFRTSLGNDEFKDIIMKTGFAVVSQTGKLVPADKKLYALRNDIAAVESVPLISSSIMSKKLATGADALVLDIKVGNGAFMKDEKSAEKLAESMLSVASARGMKTCALLTDMDKPLGRAVGNSLEVIEAIEALKGNSPEDFKEISHKIAAEMLFIAGHGSEEKCEETVNSAVNSGKALEAFRRTIELQGGNSAVIDDYSLFGQALFAREIISPKDGYVSKISCEKTGAVSRSLGAGRNKKDDKIDSSAGIVINRQVGEFAKKGDVLATLYTSSKKDELDILAEDLAGAFEICENPVKARKNVIKIMRNY